MTERHSSRNGPPWKAAALAPLILAALFSLALPTCTCDVKAWAAVAEEGRVLGLLRERLQHAVPNATSLRAMPDATPPKPPHCVWQGVRCRSDIRVESITILEQTAAAPPTGGGRMATPQYQVLLLPAELAQLQYLEQLKVTVTSTRMQDTQAGVPAQWGHAGAFPSLQRLDLSFDSSADGPLPDCSPGAMPRLTNLSLDIPHLRASLPAS